MGHHSQYRRRGSTPPGESYVPQPDPPTIALEPIPISVTANDGPDIGGTYQSYQRTLPDDSWAAGPTRAWAPSTFFLTSLFTPPVYIAVTEIGNGVNYKGESTLSNIVHLV